MPGPKLPFAVWGLQGAQLTEGAAIVWGARGQDQLIAGRVIINMTEKEERDKAFYEISGRYTTTMNAMQRVRSSIIGLFYISFSWP